MTHVSASELSRTLNVTRTRVGQWVHEGKLAGCFTGEGRARRFDLDKVTVALGRQFHPGQMLGNGADTRRALHALNSDHPKHIDPSARRQIIPAPSVDGAPDEPHDTDRYELARTQKAEEEARRLRRQNAEAEGRYVLATEVERQVQRVVGQEIAEFESVLRDGARRVADKLGVEFRAVRQILTEQWRNHRHGRANALHELADLAELSAEELAEDI